MPAEGNKINGRSEYKVPGLATVTKLMSCIGLCGCKCIDTAAGQILIDNRYLKLYSILLNIFLTTVESFLLLQDYLCITKEIGGDLIIMFGINILRTTTILMVVRVLNAGLINDYISIITEIDETLGTNSCKSTDRRLMRLLVFFWSLACMKLIFDFNMIIGQNSATVFFYNINSFQLYSFVMTFFYYLSLLTLRLKALTKYVGGEEVMFQDTQMENPQLIVNEEFIKNEFSYCSKLKEIYERRGHIMRIKVIFALYKKVALWTESLEDRINVPVVFLLLSIYSNLFMPFRMTLQLFSRPSTSGLNVPLASDLCQILMFGINLIVFCESCQMLKGAIYDLIQRIEPHLNESPKHWASLTYFVRHVPTFTCYRIANVDRSLVFKFLAAVIIHGALQGQFEVAQEAARLKS